jgi:hypothetical protein
MLTKFFEKKSKIYKKKFRFVLGKVPGFAIGEYFMPF